MGCGGLPRSGLLGKCSVERPRAGCLPALTPHPPHAPHTPTPPPNTHTPLQVHYNNPDGQSGVVDASGFDISVTPRLRRHDAGVLTLGQTAIALPPGRERLSLRPSVSGGEGGGASGVMCPAPQGG